jgi:hypothetical protein
MMQESFRSSIYLNNEGSCVGQVLMTAEKSQMEADVKSFAEVIKPTPRAPVPI